MPIMVLGLVLMFQAGEAAETKYPAVEELPLEDNLPDPFQFFETDRRVENRKDWEARRAEILEMVQHYSAGPAFPQSYNAKVEDLNVTEVYNGKALQHKLRRVAQQAQCLLALKV